VPQKPILYLVGSKDEPPRLDDLLALFRRLTGREPTPEDLAQAKRELEHQTKPV
jgi:hypothetical protein